MLKCLGVTARQIDQLWLLKVMESEVDEAEVEKGLAWFEKLLGKRLRYDGKMLTPETLKTQIRLYLAMQMVNEDKGFDFCGLKGQRELTEHVCLGDVAEMLMNDPYDWNGAKEPTVCATEADAGAAVTMQLLKYVTGGLPSLFMDVRLYHPDLDLWDWCNSGNHASWYAARSSDAGEELQARSRSTRRWSSTSRPAGRPSSSTPRRGAMTFARMGLWDEKPFMAIIPGEAVEAPREGQQGPGRPDRPDLAARLGEARLRLPGFLNVFPCNHAQGAPGDLVQALTMLCDITGIKPVVLGRERQQPVWELVG